MSSVHIQSTAGIIRWYDTGSYEERSTYKAVASYVVTAPDTIFMYGMHGDLSKEDMAAMFLELYKKGIRTILAERKGTIVSRDIEQLLKKNKLL